MSSRTVLSGGDVVLYEGVMHDGVVVIENGVIDEVCLAAEFEPRDSDALVNCGGRFVCPGFIDLHNQGGGGFTVMDGSAEHIQGMCKAHAAHGTTGLLLTPVIEAAGYANLLPHLAEQTGAETGGAAVLGIHAEGPFLSSTRRGCMPFAGIATPDERLLDGILEAGDGTIREMTIAPELPGAPELILKLAKSGVVPSLGHSDATLNDVLRAIDYGAQHVTHMYNVMTPLHHREPGLVGTALFSPELTVELVADGHHVHPWVMGLTVQNKRVDRTCLVTDAMEVMGEPDGDYMSLGSPVRLEAGRLTLANDPSVLAGSVLGMDTAVANMVNMVGVTLSEAVAMASASPAAVLGIDIRKGRIAPGYDGDITVLDDRYRTAMTIVGGVVVHDREDA